MSGSGSPEAAPRGERCVVLGGGGLTGIAWLAGVLTELPPVLSEAERVIGTSAGALLAARLLSGADAAAGLTAQLAELARVRLPTPAVARLLLAQVWPSRRHALQWLGRSALRPVSLAQVDFVRLVQRAIGASDWPPSLVVVAVDALAGRPAYFTARSGVPLALAVAASCAMPGVLPPVWIEDRHFIDGGLRSPANADLATGCNRVLVLAPQWRSARVVRRPGYQVQKLRGEGADVLLVQSSNSDRQVLSASVLPRARQRGRDQGMAVAGQVVQLWRGRGHAW